MQPIGGTDYREGCKSDEHFSTSWSQSSKCGGENRRAATHPERGFGNNKLGTSLRAMRALTQRVYARYFASPRPAQNASRSRAIIGSEAGELRAAAALCSTATEES